MSAAATFLFPVPGPYIGEQRNRGTRNTSGTLNFGSTTVPGTFREHLVRVLFPVPGYRYGEQRNEEQS